MNDVSVGRAGSQAGSGEVRGVPENLVDLLQRAAQASACELICLGDDGETSEVCTAADLWTRAGRVAAGIGTRAAPGEVVLIVLPNGLDFAVSFFGCVLAGLVPAPLAVPSHERAKHTVDRLLGAAQQSKARLAIVDVCATVLVAELAPDLTILHCSQLEASEVLRPSTHPTPDSPAYLQFTSGSCGRPRGVILSHRAVVANSKTIHQVFGHDASSSALTWLPLHHDMGLVGHVLQPLYFGGRGYLMSPKQFSRAPLRWLEAISRYRVVSSGAPPFAFALCAEALAKSTVRLDLSCWRNAYVGAEMVQPEILEAFAAAAEVHGFVRECLLPCYGLAESTLFVAGTQGVHELRVASDALVEGRAVESVSNTGVQRVMAYPPPPGEQLLRIVDPVTYEPCADGQVGEIWLCSPSVGAGYIGDDKATADTFGARLIGEDRPNLRTGDLGFVAGGNVHLVGRLKNLIIVRGRNHHAEDLEQTVLVADPGPWQLRVACFAIPGPDTDQLVVVRETSERAFDSVAAQSRLTAIAGHLSDAHELSAAVICLVPQGSIALTTSGKVSRMQTRSALLDGNIRTLASAPATLPFAVQPTSSPNCVAVIGMAVRFPAGADDLESFWTKLVEGQDCITEIPASRWDVDQYYSERPAPGKMNTRWGGFIDDVSLFDANFFEISGHEAAEMDPQQRLLLEVAWRALEHAGISDKRLRGSRTGVFIGSSGGDYLRLKVRADPELRQLSAYSGLGNAASITANRISYVFDLRGPSVAVDTACSSSLTALHVAAESIRNGECDMAIAGGVNLLLAPDATVLLSQFGMMAPDGRCKVFAANADGYVRSEGCGLVVLERGTEALRNADAIHAWIRGSALAQDGRSRGITAPNRDAQRALLRSALGRAQIPPESVTYVEAHGTGTAIGDPAEWAELNACYGPGRDTCLVGSVKAHIGHLEGAAGVASFIKTVLAMQHGELPGQLHLETVHPALDRADSRLRIIRERCAWESPSGPRRAAISSFGFGGALVHMIVEQHQAPSMPTPPPKRGDHHSLLLLSARSQPALTELVATWGRLLSDRRFDALEPLCRAAACRRTHHRFGMAVVAETQAGLRQSLERVVVHDRHAGATQETAFMFSGQGDLWPGMGRHLYARHQVFHDAFVRCAAAWDGPPGQSLASLTFDPEQKVGLVEHSQPAVFALEYALAQLWMSWGVVPRVVFGHSLGELTAACVAGCMSAEDGVRFASARGRLMAGAPGDGAMLTVFAGYDQVIATMRSAGLDVEIAALNAPGLTVISGREQQVLEASTIFGADGVKVWTLHVSHAFHSRMMDPILDEIEAAAAAIEFRPPAIPLVSTRTGQIMRGAPTPAHWRAHVREVVRFADAVDCVLEIGVDRFIELGPARSLCSLIRRCRPAQELELLPCLDEEVPGRAVILTSLERLYAGGAEIDWDAVFDGPGPQAWGLPNHPFHRRRYWFDEEPEIEVAEPDAVGPAIYVSRWRAAPLVERHESTRDSPPHWIVVGAGDGLSDELASALAESSEPCYLLRPNARTRGRGRILSLFANSSRDIHVPVTASADDYAATLNYVINRLARVDAARWRVVYIGGLDTAPEGRTTSRSLELDQATVGSAGLVALIKATQQFALHLQLWVVTRDARPVSLDGGEHPLDGGEHPLNVSQAPLWGLMRTAMLEHPQLRGGLVDLDRSDHEAAKQLLAQIRHGSDEAQVAFRGATRYIEELVRVQLPASSPALKVDPSGAYVITGGMGGLGLRCASWLVRRGAKRVVLVGRNAPPAIEHGAESVGEERWASVRAAIAELEAAGATVETAACDVRDHERVAAVLTDVRRRGRLAGVIHAAGINWFARVVDLERAAFLEALAVKVSAAWNLHRLTLADKLDLFVLFSSVSALWGSVELSHYTASNQFLGALCHLRRNAGLVATAVDWGPWAEVGMSAGQRERELLGMLGLELMAPEHALAAMERAIVADLGQCVIADINWRRFESFADFSSSPSLFAGIRGATECMRAPSSASIESLRGLSVEAAHEHLQQLLASTLAMVMHVPGGRAIDLDTRFNFMGMDSLVAMAFCARLESVLGVELPAVTVYNHPTIRKMAVFIYAKATSGGAGASALAPATSSSVLFEFGPAPKRFRLLCFPHAGAGPSVYAEWIGALGPDVEVVPLQLPGREHRLTEPPFSSLTELVTSICDDLQDRDAGLFGIFGHSFGGLVGFEVARELARRGDPPPALLVVSACAPPGSVGVAQLHLLDDEAFLVALRSRYGVVPQGELDPELQHALLPALRSDVEMIETHVFDPSPPLAGRLHVFGGRRDPLVSANILDEWEAFVSGVRPQQRLFDGDHMFIRDSGRAQVLAELARLIHELLDQD